ncbi:hypothetical protein PGT21_036921 [Puccinia graminis f. sp. tritici]|nr:hypothetical protein PGT21_036921 [Puccinia graminis f. sp. tritici]
MLREGPTRELTRTPAEKNRFYDWLLTMGMEGEMEAIGDAQKFAIQAALTNKDCTTVHNIQTFISGSITKATLTTRVIEVVIAMVKTIIDTLQDYPQGCQNSGRG